MADAISPIDEWVLRIQKTKTSKDLLKLLEQFRKIDWTDADRQKVSHTYMKMLDVILSSSAEKLLKAEEAKKSRRNCCSSCRRRTRLVRKNVTNRLFRRSEIIDMSSLLPSFQLS